MAVDPFTSVPSGRPPAGPQPFSHLDRSRSFHLFPRLQKRCLFPREGVLPRLAGVGGPALCSHKTPFFPTVTWVGALSMCLSDHPVRLIACRKAAPSFVPCKRTSGLMSLNCWNERREKGRLAISLWSSSLSPSSLGLCSQVTASQLTVPPVTCKVLLLAESEGERERWLQVLGELQRLLLDARPRPRPVYTLKEAYDNGLPLLPHTLCAAIIGKPRAEEASPAQGSLGGGVRARRDVQAQPQS